MTSKTPKTAGVAASAIVPAWGDEPVLRRAVAALRNVLAARCERFEIVLVDDGAATGSSALADAIAAASAEARAIHLGAHHGRGAVLRSGSAAACLPLVLYFDPTAGFVADDLRLFLEAIREADLVVGYRAKPPTARGDRLHWWVHRQVLAILFGVFVREAECGFKLMRREILERIRLASDGDFADAELLAKANVLGARIAEVPVTLSASAARGVRPCCGRQAQREAWRLFHRPDLSGPGEGA